MGLNMSVLVKLPCMDILARPITVAPLASRPGDAAYAGRGYYDTREQDVVGEDNSVIVDQQTFLDVRDAEFAVVPQQGDLIDIPADGGVPAEGRFEVVSASPDGGGLTTLVLRAVLGARP
jgi:hypothetical protein